MQQVAEYYATTPHLEDLCFVFPNRRGGKFFEQRLTQAINGPAMMPHIIAMADFMGDITGYNQVGQLEAILVLYNAYRQVMGDNAASMDTFVYWANLIINDFNDADMNLVDVEQLYSNLRDLRNIATDYLDPDLKRDIERVLNVNLPRDGGDRFWRGPWQGGDGDGEVKQAYFDLWQRLADIYTVYHHMLADKGLHTVGRIYRDAAQLVKSMPEDRLPQRVVMVGFSSLSVSELAVFKALRQRGVAHFWWDNALQELADDSANPAGRMVGEYARMFPMPAALEPVTLAGKQVEAVAVPSAVGQAKWAFERVDQLIDQGAIPHPDNAIDTAIVLPDESLFIPLMNSVTPRIGRLNVTMGYSLRHANIVSLMHLVARAHKQATRRQGEWTYYREDVKDIMSHPIIKAVFTRQAMEVSRVVDEQNMWSVPATLLERQDFGLLFKPLDRVDDVTQVIAYIDRLMAFCNQVSQRIRVQDGLVPARDGGDDPDREEILPLQSAFIALYVEALEQLQLAFSVHGVPVTNETLFYLIDRLTQAYVVPFEGEPLQGLQVMGLQETRSLDFDNLIVLSMNERVFPRKHGIASLIPDDLRAAFYMLTGARQEAIAAYDFYRLVSRAQRVVLVHNSAMGGVGSSAPSRFILQLQLLYSNLVQFTDCRVDTRVTSPGETVITVDKSRAPMHDYVNPSANDAQQEAKCLSHSSLVEYLDCPLKFYFHHVQHLSDDVDKGDFMDSGTFGDIIHHTLQELYYPMKGDAPRHATNTVTRQQIEHFKAKTMHGEVQRQINLLYAHHDKDAELEGEALILQDTIETFVMRALNYDLKLLDENNVDSLEVLECEMPHRVQLDFDGVKFNFTYMPDRVDRVGGQLRMVDYKTGGDDTVFGSVGDLFRPSQGSSWKRHKAIMQQMLYCNAWHLQHPADRIIKPVIYKLKDMSQTGVWFKEGRRGRQPFFFDVDSDMNAQFISRMAQEVASLLDRAVPFTQAEPGSKCCEYCAFAEFCHR